MIDRLRALLDHPLDPSVARAILVFAGAILAGFAGLFVFAAGQSDVPIPSSHPSRAASSPISATAIQEVADHSTEGRVALGRQDPQDVEDSAAARRAARALRSHRALQHVPYRSEDLKVDLIGARGRGAVLRIEAATVHAARRGWRDLLRRYHDPGHAYIPVFQSESGGAR
jgi:hypothetical protein